MQSQSIFRMCLHSLNLLGRHLEGMETRETWSVSAALMESGDLSPSAADTARVNSVDRAEFHDPL
jgi:hypothetical protein